MSWTVKKGGLSVSADTEEELRIALAVLSNGHVANVPSLHIPIEADIVGAQGGRPEPSWRVGGPPDDKPDDKPDDDPKPLALVRPTESCDSVPESTTVAHIALSPPHMETLDCILLFTEGVSASGIATLTGIKNGTAHSRIQHLKRKGLVERVKGHELWVATPLARRAKLVRA